jgi:hypothetical protein
MGNGDSGGWNRVMQTALSDSDHGSVRSITVYKGRV